MLLIINVYILFNPMYIYLCIHVYKWIVILLINISERQSYSMVPYRKILMNTDEH